MSKRYDLVIVGGGTAGIVAGRVAASLGARVALVEELRPGGDCLFTGCVPSKSLLASAALAQRMRTADRLGLEAVDPSIDFGRVMDRVQGVIAAAGKPDTVESLTAEGIDVVSGRARFVGPQLVATDSTTLNYRAAVIASGSHPAVPPIPGLNESGYLTNETVWDLPELPQKLVIIGGGPVGVELAQAFARLGSSVDLVEVQPTLLPAEEPEAGKLITERLVAEGVAVHTGARALRADHDELYVAGSDTQSLAFDRLLVAVGRMPATQDLGLDQVGVETGSNGAVLVDRHLRTTARSIYAAGDVVGELYFTHVAGYHGLVAAANALLHARRKVDHTAIPWAIFTDPELARVGLTEAQARTRLGTEPIVLSYDYNRSDRALTAANPTGFAKLVTDRKGRLLGATIVAEAAGESIAEVARLVRERRKVSELSAMVHAYPTFTEGPARAADNWWTLRYLTPRTRRLLRPVLAAMRFVERRPLKRR